MFAELLAHIGADAAWLLCMLGAAYILFTPELLSGKFYMYSAAGCALRDLFCVTHTACK
jgi:hypothetical protein